MAPRSTEEIPQNPVLSESTLCRLVGSGVNTGPRPRRGPKPKPIHERVLKDVRPIQRAERSWSQRQKIRTLVFLSHHRIPVITDKGEYFLRPPTQIEASDLFGIPQRTISNWLKKQEDLEKVGVGSTIRSKRTEGVLICKWPELETRLYSLFLERRSKGQAIRRGWFRRHANQIFRELFPNSTTSIFRFSNGWFEAFLGRFRISLRCITKKAQKIPEDYRQLVISWLQFNRRVSQPPCGNWMQTVLNRSVGRFLLSNICNIDETPLPFEYLSGRTYDAVGSRTVWVKESRSGWDKRQASLVLCIFADGANRIPPLIIFHGKGTVYEREASLYHPGVLVEFNNDAYMNDQLFLKYIEQHLLPALNGRSSLLTMDLCTSHKTPTVLTTLKNHDIIPSFIPAGCTSLVQPLDISINKPLKDRIKELTDEAIIECESADDFERWGVGERRVLTTQCVGDAWYQFCIERADVIRASFSNVGLSLPVDGSADHKLNIKGFEDLIIGDWSQALEGPYNPVNPNPAELFADVPIEDDDSKTVEFIAHGE